MDWLDFVKLKSAVPTSGELWNDLWVCVCSFPSRTLKVGADDLGRGHIGQMAEIEITFGKPMKTSGMFILNLTPGQGVGGLAGRRGYALRTVALYPKKRGRMGATKRGGHG